MIRGNHDRVFTNEELSGYFEKIIEEFNSMCISDNTDGSIFATHYPTLASKNSFNLVGHIHGAWRYQLNSINVGVDVHHFRPINLEDIPFHMEAIKKYYDDDVWDAYHESNEFYRDKRGVRGSYAR